MIGSIVHQELLLGSRRNRLYVFRCLYGVFLVIQVFYFYVLFLSQEEVRYIAQIQTAWLTRSEPIPLTPNSAPHVVGTWFAHNFITQQFILLAIATPALVAGAITDEKRRGTLQYLLLCDVGTRSLLLGKLLGRVVQVGVLALVGLPLFALLSGFAGVDPLTLLAVATMVVVTVFAVAAAALLASVWCRQTRDAVLALYAVGVALGVAVWQLGGVLEVLNPLWVFDSYDTMGAEELVHRLVVETLTWVSVGSACLGLAVWRLKPAYLRELEGAPARKTVWYGGRRPAVDDEPVRWRERNVEGLAPAAGLRRIPYWLAVTILVLVSTASALLILGFTMTAGTTPADVFAIAWQFDFRLGDLFPGAARGFLAQGVIVMLLASLVVGVRCSGAVTGERERQTWEPLLLTPLSASELIRGKLWGIMGASYGYLLAYGLPAILLSVLAGPLATIWTIVWLGVTVLAMYFIGAAGLWASVRSKSSWQALLKTLAWGYVLAALLNTVMSILLYIILSLILVLLIAVDVRMQTALSRTFLNNLGSSADLVFFTICISLALCCWFSAKFFLSSAQRSIAQRERTRHWPVAPVYRRAKRRPRQRMAT
jgi:ABC-type transport system involved in multi-copper enzyme maturation permease subunit